VSQFAAGALLILFFIYNKNIPENEAECLLHYLLKSNWDAHLVTIFILIVLVALHIIGRAKVKMKQIGYFTF